MDAEDKSRWIVRPIVPEEVYTDRKEFLDYFYNAALAATERRTMSTVLLGQRRMGKTEIFKRVVNRLFFEQDPQTPNAVVPVYYSFPDARMDERTFGEDYIGNFLRHYLAFYTGNPKLARLRCSGEALVAAAKNAVSAVPSGRDPRLDAHDAQIR